ncbi:MAG: lysylphosphatidylglycerol synthase transmembrane domain-containing protein [Candidatus Sumerlaeaceae bacterium]
MRNPKVQLIIGVLLSALFLYIAMREVKMAELWAAVRTFNWWWAIPFLAINFLSLWIRAWRWKYLMAPTAQLGTGRLFSPMMVGFAINSLLPARAGEFARAYVLGKKEKLPYTSVFATIVVERIFDSLTLLLLLAYVFATIQFDPSIEFKYKQVTISGESLKHMSANITKGFLVMLAAALLLLWPAARMRMQLWAENWPYAPRRFRVKIAAMIGTFAEGFASLKSGRIIAIVLVQSMLVWVTIAWSFQIMPYGIQGMKTMDITQATALVVISCIAIIIPAAPGYWGLMELGIVFGLKILGIESDPSRAIAYALLIHGLQYFPIVAVGLYFLWREQVTIGEISHRPQVES